MMEIKIPKSLFDAIEESNYRGGRPLPLGAKEGIMCGPFGEYKVIAVPDEEFCEEAQVTKLVYVGLK